MPSSTQQMYQAVKLNNVAVHQTIAGCDEERVSELLYIAVGLVSEGGRKSGSSGHLRPLASSSCLNPSKRVLPAHGAKDGFLFQALITFPTPNTRDYENIENCRILASSILLNLAIVFHRKAMALVKRSQSRDSLLNKAEELYEKAMKVVPSGTAASEEGSGLGTAVMVKLAAINNISQIRRERGDSPHEAFAEALQLLFDQVVKQSHERSSGMEHRCCLDLKELKGMLLNIGRKPAEAKGKKRRPKRSRSAPRKKKQQSERFAPKRSRSAPRKHKQQAERRFVSFSAPNHPLHASCRM